MAIHDHWTLCFKENVSYIRGYGVIIAWTIGRLFLLNPLHLNKPWNAREKVNGHGTTFRESGHILENVGLSSINYLECFYLYFLVTNCNLE